VEDGWRVLASGLDLERLASAAIATGAAGLLIEHVSGHLRRRKQFGRPLSELQAVRHRLADLAMEVDGAELAAFRTARRMAAGIDTNVEASVAKLSGTEAYMHVAHAAVQLEGGYGYTLDTVVQRHFRDAKMYEIGGGASDVQREIIAKGILR
jgi:alkylation response protein AidB-like acyl-CoA dehydrogenase